MQLEFTRHARDAMEKRAIHEDWVRRVAEHPRRMEPDRLDEDLEHRLAEIPEHGGRVLRVVLNVAVLPIRVVTVYFDRNMKGKL
ncbi:DUF4258 domain-containing protein [Methylocaldum sp. GT1BB]|jgi:hypothetical protein|uniref:DUF4258 domain-containing protein n=1 Tax=Methylocaldum sp. GT1BB TaxID=3438963 RepID=UPI003DA0868B